MSTRQKEIVETFQSEVSLLTIVETWRKHCKPLTIGSRESWNYCLTDQENLGTTV